MNAPRHELWTAPDGRTLVKETRELAAFAERRHAEAFLRLVLEGGAITAPADMGFPISEPAPAPTRAPEIGIPMTEAPPAPETGIPVSGAAPAPPAPTAEPEIVTPPPPSPAEPDPYRPDGPAMARLRAGERMGDVALDLGLDVPRLKSAWMRACKAYAAAPAPRAEPDRGPVMDAARPGELPAPPAPAPKIPEQGPLDDGWARCARCKVAFNAARAQRDLKLPSPPTKCGACR
jgi:hypothetical protein